MLRLVAGLAAAGLVAAAALTAFLWLRSSSVYKDGLIVRTESGDGLIVRTESGLVRGFPGPRNAYIAWLGIPYAAPPTGTKRFKSPTRPFSWKGIFDANRTVYCPQHNEDIKAIEDCLVVNIFSPMKINDSFLSVLVFIHGGAFFIGYGEVEGVDLLVENNIVVVTINYRLGALGFLCLGIKDAPGNAGLRDQIAALQWIQRNIKNFRGDPNKVTVYGVSSGGASVELLVLSKQSKGLFKQAIVESASATAVWTVDANPIKTALFKIKIPTKKINVHAIANYYQRIPATVLAKTNWKYLNSFTDGTFGFVPCVESTSFNNHSDAVLTEPPYKTLIKERYTKVPMMFMYSALEGLFLGSHLYYKRNYKKLMSENFLNFLPADLHFDNPEIAKAMADKVRSFYFGNRTIGEDIMDHLRYFGDYLILHGLLNSVQIHSRNDNPVYLMEFAYKGNIGGNDKFYESIKLAGHGDIYRHAILHKQPETAADKLAVARVTKLIANFVNFGNPTPKRSHILPILWPRVYPDNVSALYMDEEFRIIVKPRWFVKEFWDGLYSKYRRKILPVQSKIP